MARLDELDTAILREMQADARRTNRDIAAAVGVSPTTALDRTRSLRQRGVIRGALLECCSMVNRSDIWASCIQRNT